MSGDFDIVNVVQMVNGERKYGLLLKRKATVENPHWEFVPFGNLRSYVHSKWPKSNPRSSYVDDKICRPREGVNLIRATRTFRGTAQSMRIEDKVDS